MVVVTGSGGFIGKNLSNKLPQPWIPLSLRDSGWREVLRSRKPQSVVHLAGIAEGGASEHELLKINVEGTRALAEEAILGGVQRFLFVSSIRAVGEHTTHSSTFSSKTKPAPASAYGKSKWVAEQLLWRLSLGSHMEVVVIRPPLVYGPGVKGNFRDLLDLVEKEIPAPLSAMDQNRRSFVAVSNLVHLMLRCLEHPAVANQTFHVSDDDNISTAELLRRMGRALGKPVRNVPIPASALKAGLCLAGKSEFVDKLFGDLSVDIEHTKRTLGWKPKVTMEEELERTAKWWHSCQGRGDF